MACEAARKYVVKALRCRSNEVSAELLWGVIGWWTPETIEEALGDLVKCGAVARLNYPDGVRYCFIRPPIG